MAKKALLIVSALMLVFLIASASAYTYYYPRHPDYGSTILSYFDNNRQKSSTYFENKETVTVPIPGGTKRITTFNSEEVITNRYIYPTYPAYPEYNYYDKPYYDYPRDKYYKPYDYGPTYKESAVRQSNWRFKEPYPIPFNTYTTPYYYEPRYDKKGGYFNWRY